VAPTVAGTAAVTADATSDVASDVAATVASVPSAAERVRRDRPATARSYENAIIASVSTAIVA
jgi:hypothetical protein